uniref:Uncharacterized protein n=1 Tax=Amphimedon queenslandica TaxID=400682 RepID=A0A1X7UVI6_AMPQE
MLKNTQYIAGAQEAVMRAFAPTGPCGSGCRVFPGPLSPSSNEVVSPCLTDITLRLSSSSPEILVYKRKSVSYSYSVMKLIDTMATTYNRLTSRDPSSFWISGQWMTERGGGSDVEGLLLMPSWKMVTGIVSMAISGSVQPVTATDADMTFTLADVQEESGQVTDVSTEGISLFYIKARDTHGSINNIRIKRLKNKLGTRQLPTAQLLLDGTMAQLIGEKGHGNITYITNAPYNPLV